MKLHKIKTTEPKDFSKEKTKDQLHKILAELDSWQYKFYAESKRSLLIIIQGMDASGKDGVIRDVIGAFSPAGIQVASFKKPTDIELTHDFLWRIHQNTPAKGMIQVFNRSHYEDVLIQRVEKWINEKTVFKRFKQINNFENMLKENGTIIKKYYLHVSKTEQKKRLDERIKNPEKNWKHQAGDAIVNEKYEQYIEAYQDAIKHCNDVPWQIIPADNNTYKSYLIAKDLLSMFKKINPELPVITQS